MTTETKHTPGPWEYYQPSEFPNDWRIARKAQATSTDDKVYVCRLTASHDPKQSGDANGAHELREADARLIAAAPELLEALRLMVDASEEGDPCALAMRIDGAAQLARAAIAKASP